MSTLLRCENLEKTYGNNLIIKGIDFQMQNGEFVSLVGASGSGKSTFLHLLASLEKMDSGEIYLEAMPYSQMNTKNKAKMRNEKIGFVYQFHHLLPDFSLLENIMLPGAIKGQNTKEIKDHALELMNYMGIQDLQDRKPQQVSGGELQRASIARALINKPKLLLADEPTGNLDEENTYIVQSLFEKINKEKEPTNHMATHDKELSNIAQKRYKMTEGKIQEI